MSNNDDSSGGAFRMIGASLLMLFFASILVKTMKRFFIELGESFEAFGHMTGSFISMLWNVFQVVSLVSMTIAGLACAIYFTIKYFEMVKEGTALREWVQASRNEFEIKLDEKMNALDRSIKVEMYQLDSKLTQALAKPEVAPSAELDTRRNLPSVDELLAAAAEDDSEPDEFEDTDEDGDESNDSEDPEEIVTMSNPY
jgi:hypothetical protein